MVFNGNISPRTAAKPVIFYEESQLSVKEIAAKLKISRSSVYRLVQGSDSDTKEKTKSERKGKTDRGARQIC